MKLIADTHTHTIASGHAYSTITENARAAADAGLEFLCVTDHASTMPGAPHHWHFVNQRVLPDFLSGVRIVRGVEANILNSDGELDLPLYVYASLEWVNASLHEAVFKAQNEAAHTQAMVNAMESQLVDAIAHPGNPSYPIDIERVVSAAADLGVAIELNNSSLNGSRKGSEPNCLAIAALAKEKGAWITTGSDAHFSQDVGNLGSVATLIEQVGMSREQVITSSAALFEEFQFKRHSIRQRRLFELGIG
ncbi:phosphatase [Enterovibrio paralichthyis]|uniref:phosphatase n=1 Tax=Enterovibrio paralichthyis TaxID=2853805 RepID=UPI001C449139|nr:phosphatase [Enterovibrio paralichthyis]MBV7297181.1 phosphatase [Enterovibrio paralichthyis]